MRLGGPVWFEKGDADDWVRQHHAWGYGAAVFPLKPGAASDDIARFVRAAADGDLVIAEVGAWTNNPISPDDETRRAGIAGCQAALALAEEAGARCCVNVAGSRSDRWAAPHMDNLSDDTFALVVDSVREIVDAVKPTRTVYALESMPWAWPDSAEAYLKLIEAVDRPGFGVHLDPVNLICSPRHLFQNAALIREMFRLLGPRIVSAHAKDVDIRDEALVHIDEVRPGLGHVDYATLLREMDALHADTPLIIEHLPSREDYQAAADHISGVAEREGIAIVRPGAAA